MSRRTRPVLALVAVLVIGVATAGQATARLGYPFLDAGAVRDAGPFGEPDVVYLPSYSPARGTSSSMRFGMTGNGFDFEMRCALAAGGELVVWESTRSDATLEQAVGPSRNGDEILGAVAKWQSGVRSDSGDAVLHARIGQTLVVITGPVTADEMLRIADSLRRASPYSMML